MISLILGAASLMLYTFLTTVSLFMISMAIQGFILALLEFGVNSWVLQLWGEKCSTYMQALHLSGASGLFFGPFILGPFSGLEPKSETTDNPMNETIKDDFIMTDRAVKVTAKPLIHFQLVFIMAGALMIVSALVQLILFVMENRLMRKSIQNQLIFAEENSQSQDQETRRSSENNNSNQNNSRTVFILGALTLLFYAAIEINSFNFVTTFVHFLNYDVETASHQAGIMTGAFALFRVFGIFVSRVLTTDKMVLIHLSSLIMATIILILFAQVSLIWVSIGLFTFGASCSVLFPSIYSMIEERIRLSNVAVSILMFCGYIASVIYPAIMPRFLKDHPLLFVYYSLISAIIVIIIVSIIIRTTKHKEIEQI